MTELNPLIDHKTIRKIGLEPYLSEFCYQTSFRGMSVALAYEQSLKFKDKNYFEDFFKEYKKDKTPKEMKADLELAV